MSPVTHFFTSWVVANTAKISRRERVLVTIAGVIPDVDGLVIIANFLTRHSDRPLQWWGRFHHVLAHNVTFALVVTLCSFALAKRRWVTFSNSWQWIWKGQWALNAWPNFLITGVALILTFFLSWRLGYSPFEMASRKVDRAFVGALRERFG
ncbi:MAG: metal-dependent hydrolase [Deltaproteobacteria bacterium]|nr:metal-dependent hydrolase [Deltaproteobacteria bacterium]